MIDLGTLVTEQVCSTAEWRRQKADEHPGDARRNMGAAERLERIAETLSDLEGGDLHRRLAALSEANGFAFSEALSDLTRDEGFRSFSDSGAEFLVQLASRVESVAA